MKNRRGYTLAEAAIGMLLVAIMASSVFSVAVSTRRGSDKSLKKLVADQSARQLTEMLKNYVTADQNTTLIHGPANTTNSWSLNGAVGAPVSGGGILDDCGTGTWSAANNCYALANGSHTLFGLLPTWFTQAPYNATITYFVWTQYTLTAGPMPGVNVTVSWVGK